MTNDRCTLDQIARLLWDTNETTIRVTDVEYKVGQFECAIMNSYN